jgi:hypothetical protein
MYEKITNGKLRGRISRELESNSEGDMHSPETEVCNKSWIGERLRQEQVNDKMKEGNNGENRDSWGYEGDRSG